MTEGNNIIELDADNLLQQHRKDILDALSLSSYENTLPSDDENEIRDSDYLTLSDSDNTTINSDSSPVSLKLSKRNRSDDWLNQYDSYNDDHTSDESLSQPKDDLKRLSMHSTVTITLEQCPQLFTHIFNSKDHLSFQRFLETYAHPSAVFQMNKLIKNSNEYFDFNKDTFLLEFGSVASFASDGILQLKKVVPAYDYEKNVTIIGFKWNFVSTSTMRGYHEFAKSRGQIESILDVMDTKKMSEASIKGLRQMEQILINSNLPIKLFIKFRVRLVIDNITKKLVYYTLNGHVSSFRLIPVIENTVTVKSNIVTQADIDDESETTPEEEFINIMKSFGVVHTFGLPFRRSKLI